MARTVAQPGTDCPSSIFAKVVKEMSARYATAS